MPRTRILLGDDHSIILDGLTQILSPRFEIVGKVNNGRALVAEADRLKPDVVVADISMPLLNGIEAARQIKKKHPRIKIIFLTMHIDVAYSRAGIEAGGSGYVVKHVASSELVTAIEEVLKGNMYIASEIAPEVMQALAAHRLGGKPLRAEITARQREVLQLVAEGHTIEEIADILNISARTVQYHKYGLMNMLGFKRTAELIQYAAKIGLGPC